MSMLLLVLGQEAEVWGRERGALREELCPGVFWGVAALCREEGGTPFFGMMDW